MIKYLRKVMLVVFCAVIASAFLPAPAMAKDRIYHRVDNTHIIVVPEKRQAPSPKEYRLLTDAQAKELQTKEPQVKTSEAELKKVKKHKYHEMGTTSIVYLRTMPPKGYQPEEEYLKSKKTEAKPKSP